MKRKRTRLLLAVAALAVLGGGILAYRVTRPDLEVTHEQVKRIQPGMTLAEVEGILGGPPGDHTRGRYTSYPAGLIEPGDDSHLVWVTRSGTAYIALDGERRVDYAAFCPEAIPRQTWYDRILARLGF